MEGMMDYYGRIERQEGNYGEMIELRNGRCIN